ncbi:carboxypeptidase regulatory-like domain-containing protein [Sporichthya polymorpha]|uniref:carboxypeptidase regulatory-like domain-containing protein n=1 Tax=Sporichthya polymorpha TaxID=35751 RepID=UPI00037AB677|nr:carboxypeptidase regulatory-like domain-containing protein [Sporichthya polymorpha]
MRTFRDLPGATALALAAVLTAPVAVVALPATAVARSAEVAPATNLQAEAFVDEVTLTWQDPAVPGLATVVRGKPGKVPPSSPTDGFALTVGSGSTTATAYGLESDTPYSFAVFARDLAGEYAAPATITVSSLTVSISAPAKVVRPNYATISGKVTDAITGAPVGFTPVHLFAVPTTTEDLIPIGTANTHPDGRYSFQLVPPEHALFVALAVGDAQHLSGGAVSSLMKVVASVALRTLNRMQPLGAYFSFQAKVDPVSTKVPVVLQQRVGKTWKTVQKAKPNRRGVVNFKIKPTKRGKVVFRAKRGAVPGAAAGTSKNATITVR